MTLKSVRQELALTVCAVALILFATGCKGKKKDDYIHVDVYGQMDSRYYPVLASRFRTFSHERAKLPTGHKILVSAVMEANFYDRLADPAYRAQAQMIVLNSPQEAAVDPNLAVEFVHARKGCVEQVPCYLLIPNSVSGEQREAAQQLLDYLAPAVVAPPPTPVPAAAPTVDANPATAPANPQQ
jgi:hypothetical protein